MQVCVNASLGISSVLSDTDMVFPANTGTIPAGMTREVKPTSADDALAVIEGELQ